jgi:hypothetical protein
MKRGIGKLYHLAEASNLASILQHGLMSTERLLDLACVAKPERDVLLRVHRPDNIRLSGSVVIRDQRPMPPAAVVRALDDGLEPSDWYALLNSFVFLWPDPERLKRQRRACGDRPQVVLTSAADPYLIGLRMKLSCRLSIAATRAAKRPGDFSSIRNLAAGGLADGPTHTSSGRISAPLHGPCRGALYDWCQQSVTASVSKLEEEKKTSA